MKRSLRVTGRSSKLNGGRICHKPRTIIKKIIKILGSNQRPLRAPGPFKGPSSYHQFYWWSLIEIFKSKAILVGSPTINKGILVSVAGMLEEIKGLKFKNKKAAAFGSYGWSGESTQVITEALQSAGFEIINDGIKVLWQPDTEASDQCNAYGQAFAASL